jgi:ribosome-associated protein
MDEWISITEKVRIPLSEMEFKFSRSGGRGGQHVNKVSTKVELLFSVRTSKYLSAELKTLLEAKLSGMCDTKGVIHIISQQSRSQWQNRQITVDKFIALVRGALHREKKRTPTKPTRASRNERIYQKKQRGKVKTIRGKTIDPGE